MRKKILIVDDEETFAQLVKFNLEETGEYEVRIENQGTRALAAAREFNPDLILLDVIMPDIDGGEVASQILSQDTLKNIPIVFLTAVVTKEETNAEDGVIAGRYFIPKPVSTKELIVHIEKNINRPRR